MKNILFIGLFLLPAASAQADPRDDALSAVLHCSGVSDKGQRLACYDSAAVRVPGALRAPSQPVAATAPVIAAPVAAAPVAAAPTMTASAAPPVRRHRDESFLDKLFGSGPNRAPQTTVAEFGSESIANGGQKAYPQPMDNDTIDEITARLVNYDVSSGYLVATLDNGQVWRQVSGDPVGHLQRAAAAYSVTVSRGGAGAYAMKLSHFGRTLAVRRIR
jgi:hypothetical protein